MPFEKINVRRIVKEKRKDRAFNKEYKRIKREYKKNQGVVQSEER